MRKRILLIEDNEIAITKVKRFLRDQFELFISKTKREALSYLNSTKYDLILLDINLPDSKGVGFLEELTATFSDTPIMILTEEEDPDLAADVIKLGAKEYIRKSKVMANKDLLIQKIKFIFRCEDSINLSQARAEQISTEVEKIFFPELPEYKSILSQAKFGFMGGLNLLISGESGTGKNELVKYLHRSLMPETPLIKIDCGAICESLVESELFGYEKDSFTGAEQTKKGKIELANGGVLFLDEISNAKPDIQAKLLAVLQDKKVSRVGSAVEIPVDFLLVTASNRDLLEEIKEGRFKEDLYYRIKQVDVRLPALRESTKSLKYFIDHFIGLYNRKYKIAFELTSSQKEIMMNKSWTGNIRELEGEVQKLVLANSLGQFYEIQSDIKYQTSKAVEANSKFKFFEKEKYELANLLEKHRYNVTSAAKELGIPRTTLSNRIKKYQLN